MGKCERIEVRRAKECRPILKSILSNSQPSYKAKVLTNRQPRKVQFNLDNLKCIRERSDDYQRRKQMLFRREEPPAPLRGDSPSTSIDLENSATEYSKLQTTTEDIRSINQVQVNDIEQSERNILGEIRTETESPLSLQGCTKSPNDDKMEADSTTDLSNTVAGGFKRLRATTKEINWNNQVRVNYAELECTKVKALTENEIGPYCIVELITREKCCSVRSNAYSNKRDEMLSNMEEPPLSLTGDSDPLKDDKVNVDSTTELDNAVTGCSSKLQITTEYINSVDQVQVNDVEAECNILDVRRNEMVFEPEVQPLSLQGDSMPLNEVDSSLTPNCVNLVAVDPEGTTKVETITKEVNPANEILVIDVEEEWNAKEVSKKEIRPDSPLNVIDVDLGFVAFLEKCIKKTPDNPKFSEISHDLREEVRLKFEAAKEKLTNPDPDPRNYADDTDHFFYLLNMYPFELIPNSVLRWYFGSPNPNNFANNLYPEISI